MTPQEAQSWETWRSRGVRRFVLFTAAKYTGILWTVIVLFAQGRHLSLPTPAVLLAIAGGSAVAYSVLAFGLWHRREHAYLRRSRPGPSACRPASDARS